MSTLQLGISHVTVSQSNKEVAISAAFDALDNSVNRVLEKTVTGGFSLTATEWTRYGVALLTGSPGTSFVMGVPATARRFTVLNLTGQDCIVEIFDSGTDAVVLGQGLHLIVTDGTDIYQLTGSGSGGGGGDNSMQQGEETASFALTNLQLSGNRVIRLNNGADQVVYLDSGLTGTEPVTFIQTGAGQWTFDEQSGATIISSGGKTKTAGLGAACTIVPDADDSNLYYLFGDLVVA